MTSHNQYKNFRLETDENRILWIYVDKENASANTINQAIMEELAAIVEQLKEDTTHEGVVIASAKKTGFIAGADITQFNQFKDIEEATQVLLTGQRVLNQLEACHIPTIALIEGFCLGGGLELALACRYRIAEEGPKTRLGLPEVKLGIHPGWGGTVRLPRLIGAPAALNLILSGHTLSAKAAAKLGFIDAAVPKRQLKHAVAYYIKNKPPKHQPTFLQSLTNQHLPRQILGAYIRKTLRKKANPAHYPAPFQVLDNWEHGGVKGEDAYLREAKSCGRLFFSETSQNLVRVFFLQEKLKSLGKEIAFQPAHIHVIAAGTMGGDIASWCALRGMRVTIQDIEPHYITPAIKRAYKLFTEKLKEPYLVQQAMDRLIPDLNGDAICEADVIIEAVVENLEIKRSVFKMVESKAKPDAIMATNTSSIPLDEINTVLNRPERLVGIHFFNPVAKMQLVEVVQGKQTDPEVIAKAMGFVRFIDHLPLPVKSSPGFLVNRILMPYLLESIAMLNEGFSPAALDRAMLDFGMPMGPITLADTIGLDVCLSVAEHLGQYFHTPVPPRLTELVAAKKLGRKTGQGFYQYDKSGKQIKTVDTTSSQSLKSIADRLVLQMLNESFVCLKEGVVANGDLLDAGMIFGTGFSPFRGGPVHYAKTQGIDMLYQQFLSEQKARGIALQEAEPWSESVV
jgi:3-hydroxyacyl-CoA dehydrogenase/enoyl-CoA hydratase/3-hydroxybutyryl-CoA epimerase